MSIKWYPCRTATQIADYDAEGKTKKKTIEKRLLVYGQSTDEMKSGDSNDVNGIHRSDAIPTTRSVGVIDNEIDRDRQRKRLNLIGVFSLHLENYECKLPTLIVGREKTSKILL